MDRYDESKHVHNRDEEHDRDERTTKPTGSVLGLGGSPVPKMPGDPSAAEEKAEGRGHAGTRGLDVGTRSSGSDEVTQSPGATGIDMGAGGSGTDLDRD